jgi:TolB-like protein/Tfp pilus assembly protein PilF
MPGPNPSATAGSSCPKCGRVLDSKTGEIVCPQCLLDVALDSSVAGNDEVSWLDSLEDNRARTDRYEILAEIARGGMGVVYRARDRGLNRTVALKMILPQQLQSAAAIQRFQSEAEAVAALDHPGILPIYEVGELDGLPFFSMKFAEGGNLANQVAGYRDRPREAARLIAHVARAIHHAHERGILHRDLKPGNILLGREGEAYVTDFGIAKWVARESRLTLDASTLGTPHYIAPEQAGGSAKLTPAADVYSLGAILYELIAGRPPFVAESALETLRLVKETAAPSPRRFNPSIPRELEVICLKCLEKEPSARYASAAALAADLERWLEGETVLARPTTSIKRALRWTKRNRVVAGLSGALLLALLTMVVAWLLLQRRPSRPVTSEASAKSIAVLPFENRSDDKQNAYFVDGVQDEILTHLAKIADLKVISSTSVVSYPSGVRRNLREIGRQLGVAYVLEGSVQRRGNRVRVTAQLIDARSDSHVWAQTYDRDLADVFAIQTEIASAISEQLRAKLSPTEKAAIEQSPTADLAAFDLYTRAKAVSMSVETSDTGKNNLLHAVELLEQAVGRDPAFVKAYCQLALAHIYLYAWFDHTPPRAALAEAAVKNAQRLAPEAGEVHLALARHFFQIESDLDHARVEIALAQKMLPNAPDSFRVAANIDRRQGRWDEHIRNLQRAADLDPRDPGTLQQLAGAYQTLRRYPEAIATLDRALALSPKNAGARLAKATIDLHSRADPLPLHATVDSLLAEDPGAAPVYADSWLAAALCERDLVTARRAMVALAGGPIRVGTIVLNHDFLEGLLARVTGDTAAAHRAFSAARTEQEKLVRAQPDYGPAVCALGLIDAGLGRKEDALREGRRAVDLVPLTKDAPGGALMIQFFAIICGWVGENDLAFEQLARAAQLPGPIFHGVHYGHLRLHPFFDPLRSDPRFEKIVASLGPISSSPAPAAPEKSIAVLPFVDLSQAKDQEYFCDGMSEELLDKLAKVEGLHVVSRTSSFFFKGKNADLTEVARRLNVQSVLDGSVRRDGNRVRITAQLVNVQDGLQLWSETYEREVQDIFAVQDNITKAIVDALKVKLAAALPTQKQRDPEAYDLYLKGLYFSNKSGEEDLRKSLNFFQRALDKDPNFARAWTGISKVWQWLADEYVKPLEAYPISLAAASKAIALDESEAEAHAYLGESARVLYWDYDKEKSELRRAIEIDPNCAPAHMFLALLLAMEGHDDQKFAELAAAKRLDPLDPFVSSFAVELSLSAYRFDDALAEAKRMNELDPTFSYFDDSLAATYRERGDLDRAIDLYEKAEAVTHVLRPGLAIAYARAGRLDDARRALTELIERSKTTYVAADGIASIYVALGDNDEAFRWLDRAVEEHSAPLEGIGQRITFRALRSDPRFADILRRIKLDPAKILTSK